MIVELRSRFDEPLGVDRLVSEAQKYEYLNSASLFLANNLDADRHLQSLVSIGGLISVDEVGHVPYESNIISLPSDYLKFYDVYDSTSATTRHSVAQMVDHSNGFILRNPYRRPPDDVLTCSFDGKSNLFIYNSTIPVSITWRYVKIPVTIAIGVETDIADRYHEILLDYAEYLGWIQIDDVPRANAILGSVMAQIVRLNPNQQEVKS